MKNKTFLFLSLPKHDGPYTSTPWQIASCLTVDNRVIFVDHPYSFSDLVSGFYKKPILKRLKAYFGNCSEKKNGVEIILPPFVWPVNFLPKGRLYNYVSQWNHRMLAARVNRYLGKNRIESVIFINSFNFYFANLHKYISARKEIIVYHCIDPMIKSFTLKHGSYLQDLAAKEADLIISTAPALQQNFISKGFSKSFLVPNAANASLFEKAFGPISIHPSVAHLTGKVMGYLGNIERRIDFDLLLSVVNQLEDWTLVLAGPVEKQYIPPAVIKHKRIFFTGAVPHEDSPAVVKRFDVALIPFKCDSVSSGIYPLKLFEYLAAGKPVVSTNFNPDVLTSLNDQIHTAYNARQFAEFILLSSTTDNKEKRLQRQKVARANDWDSRARDFNSIISIELNNKQQYVPERKD
jgi:teichuronic acid biosynthesis glycosyltransferase TuaH